MAAPPVPAPAWLSPQEIADSLKQGNPVILPPIVDGEPAADRQRRCVQTQTIMDLVADRELKKPVVLSGVVLQGELKLRYIDILEDFSITGSIFEGEVDLLFATFSGLTSFEGTTFRSDVGLNNMTVKGDLQMAGAKFLAEVEARQLSVGNFSAEGARFGKASFDSMQVEHDLSFATLQGTPTVFDGPVRFINAHIKGQAVFSSAQFSSDARFDLIQIDGGAFFDTDTDANDRPVAPAVTFHGPLGFIAGSVKMQLHFSGARFEKSVDFDGLTVTGDAHFEGTRFAPPANAPAGTLPADIGFPGCHVTGQTIFQGALLEGETHFHQSLFEAETLFGGTRFGSAVKFDGAHFAGPLFFVRRNWTAPTRFDGNISFLGAKADQDVYFREKTTDTVPDGQPRQFSENANQDLRGFTYSRMHVAWKEMIDRMEPFDKQPYRQMEAVFRTMGKEKSADRVYLTQRKRSWKYHRQRRAYWPKAALETLYWAFFNFGVRPLRLFVITAGILLVSAFVLSRPAALIAAHGPPFPSSPPLPWTEGLAVALHYFMPFDVPVGGDWSASAPWALSCALVLKLAGWLFVPIGAAVFSGLARRQPK